MFARFGPALHKMLGWLATLSAVPVFLVVAIGVNVRLHTPWDGMYWSSRGWTVLETAPRGPAAEAGIRIGDRIVAMDGVPIAQRYPLYSGSPGDSVTVTLERNGQILTTMMILAQAPIYHLVVRLSILFLALVFCVLSFAFSVGNRNSQASIAFQTLYQLLAGLMATGSLSGLQVAWAIRSFYVCLALCAPATVFAASVFPVIRREAWVRWTLRVATTVGVVLALCLIVTPFPTLVGSQAGGWLFQITFLAVMVALTIGAIMLAQSFRLVGDAITRAALRISALGLIVALLPVSALYLLPRLVVGRGIVSPEAAVLFLIALPIYHGFAVTRRRFGGLESVLPSVSSMVISGAVFLAVVLTSMWIVRMIWRAGEDMALYVGAALGAVALAAMNVPLISGARRFVHHAFYGQAYDYQSIVSEMSRDLAQAVGRADLGGLVVGTLSRRMNLAGAALLGAVHEQGVLVTEAASGELESLLDGAELNLDGTLVSALIRSGVPQRRIELLRQLSSRDLGPREERLLTDERIALWVPIVVRGVLQGIVVIGNKTKDALFSQDDLDIVQTLAGQIGVSMENAELYDSLHAEMRKLQEMQAQLVQAEKLSAVGELVSGVAHELNNPLTAVMGYAELLKADLTDEDAKKDVEQILRSAERSRRIVRNLLTFARRQKSETRVADINEIVQQAVELQSYQFRMDNVRVELDLAQDLPKTVADPSQLQQVLMNVLLNAQQAIRSVRDSGLVRIATKLVSPDTIQIVISDDGPGIPPEILGRIFDPFFTTKDVGVGTGLGLSICYGIIREHGGRIFADSEPGSGATFTIELPVRRAELPVEVESEPEEEQTGLRVLMVEDEVAVAAVLARLLRRRGLQVETVNSGEEALAKLRETQQYDVIISDVKMPTMSGQALWEILSSDYPDLAERVIFITGDTASTETSEFIRQAGQPVLPKPFSTRDLAKAIAGVVK